jgi:hypothetical protein
VRQNIAKKKGLALFTVLCYRYVCPARFDEASVWVDTRCSFSTEGIAMKKKQVFCPGHCDAYIEFTIISRGGCGGTLGAS